MKWKRSKKNFTPKSQDSGGNTASRDASQNEAGLDFQNEADLGDDDDDDDSDVDISDDQDIDIEQKIDIEDISARDEEVKDAQNGCGTLDLSMKRFGLPAHIQVSNFSVENQLLTPTSIS